MDTKTETAAPVAASLDELQAHLVGADDSFLMKQLKGKVSLAQAKDNWTAELQQRLSASEKNLAEERLKSQSAAGSSQLTGLGTKPESQQKDDTAAGNAAAEFSEAVATLEKAGMGHHAAIASVAKKNPALHQAYLQATNPNAKSRRLINEKYAS